MRPPDGEHARPATSRRALPLAIGLLSLGGCGGADATHAVGGAGFVSQSPGSGSFGPAPGAAAPPGTSPAAGTSMPTVSPETARELEAAATRCAPELRLRTSVAFVPSDTSGVRDACLTVLAKPSAAQAVLGPRCTRDNDGGVCMLLASAVAPSSWLSDEDFSVFVPPCPSKERCWTYLRSRVEPTAPPTADEASATTLLESGCRGGAPAACEVLSRARAESNRERADAAQLRACELGYGLSCRKLVYAFRKQSLTPDAAALGAVVRTERAACDREPGDGASCLTLATLVDVGWASTAEAGAPDARLSRGCTLGHGIACAKSLELHVKGKRRASAPELERTASVLGTACAPDQPFTCAMFAVALKRGLGVPRDPKRAGAVWKSACETPEKACAHLGLRL